MCKVNRGYVNASLPHIGATKMRELQLMGLACVYVREDGGRGARRQSLGTEPGMPSLQAKQEHGEPQGAGLLAITAAVTASEAECAALFALVCSLTLWQHGFICPLISHRDHRVLQVLRRKSSDAL